MLPRRIEAGRREKMRPDCFSYDSNEQQGVFELHLVGDLGYRPFARDQLRLKWRPGCAPLLRRDLQLLCTSSRVQISRSGSPQRLLLN